MTAAWDPDRREERFVADGVSKLDWSGSGLELQHVELGGAPDIKRDPAATDRDAPYTVSYPGFTETDESVVLPAADVVPPAVLKAVAFDREIAGVAYHREASVSGRVFRVVATQRALKPEISAEEARASVDPLTKLGEQGVYAPAGAQQAVADDAAALDSRPTTAAEHAARGDALLNAQRFKEAEAEFDSAIDLDPKMQAAWSDRALARAWRGDPRATGDADMSDSLGKPDVAAARARAVLVEQTDPAAARAAYDRALKLAPDDEFSLVHREDVEMQLHAYDAARRDLDTFEKLHPDAVGKMHLLRAELEAGQNRREAALQEAGKAEVDMPELRHRRARLYSELQATDKALADLDAVLKAQPSSDTYLLRANLRGAGTPGGKADIAAAEALNPADLQVQLRRVNALLANGDYAVALPVLNGVIKAHPDVGDLRVGRAQVQAHLGHTAEAQADFAAARGAMHADAGLLCNQEIEAKVDASSTLQDCSRAMREAPANPVFVVDRAIAAHRLGLEAQASADVAAARALSAADAQELNSACYALAVADVSLTQALSLCDESLRLKPDAANTLESRGFVLLRLKRDAEAVTAYSAALRLKPDYALALYGRALAEERLGRHADSVRDRTEALAKSAGMKARFSDLGLSF